jgi:hypothetical protein
MRIGVLGPPGVGKTKFAKALGADLGLKVVDGYAQRLKKKTDLALGPWSSYSEHFMLAGHRLAAEFSAGDDNRITVGTIMDTLTYAMVKSDVSLHRSAEARRATYQAAQAGVQGLSLMYNETWDYHIAFHLPYSHEQRVAKGAVWETALDSAYRHVLESYGVPFCYPLEGDHDQRVEIAKEILAIAEAEIGREEQSVPVPTEEPAASDKR